MANGRERGAVEINSRRSATSGYITENASAVMPPMEGPMSVCSRSIPKCPSKALPAVAMSSSVSTGNRSR